MQLFYSPIQELKFFGFFILLRKKAQVENVKCDKAKWRRCKRVVEHSAKKKKDKELAVILAVNPDLWSCSEFRIHFSPSMYRRGGAEDDDTRYCRIFWPKTISTDLSYSTIRGALHRQNVGFMCAIYMARDAEAD